MFCVELRDKVQIGYLYYTKLVPAKKCVSGTTQMNLNKIKNLIALIHSCHVLFIRIKNNPVMITRIRT
jgi:hypothetical protein